MNVALPPSVLELCAGYGGIGLGLKLALGEVRVRAYVEREVSVARKLVARFQDGTLVPADIWSNLKTFDARPYKGEIDILCAGYPCQPFSCAGKRMGHKDPRHLWPHVARIADECQPRQIFLENVDAHARLGFFEVARELRAMGYRCAAGLFTAAEVGAPHRRQRLFVLAERERAGQQISSTARLHDRGQSRHHPYRCNTAMEDSARLPEHGQIGQDGGRRRGIRQAGNGVADSRDGLFPLSRREPQGRAGARSAGEVLAHAGCSDDGRGENTRQIARQRTSGRSGRASRTVANSAGAVSTPRKELHESTRITSRTI